MRILLLIATLMIISITANADVCDPVSYKSGFHGRARIIECANGHGTWVNVGFLVCKKIGTHTKTQIFVAIKKNAIQAYTEISSKLTFNSVEQIKRHVLQSKKIYFSTQGCFDTRDGNRKIEILNSIYTKKRQ